MRDRDYYPAGAYDDPNAPYNSIDVPEKDFEVTCSQTLSKSAIVTTDNYIPGGYGVDEDGGYQDPDDTSDTCWADEYHDNDHYTPLQLIELFKAHLEEELKSDAVAKEKISKYKHLISECEDWSEDETDYEGE